MAEQILKDVQEGFLELFTDEGNPSDGKKNDQHYLESNAFVRLDKVVVMQDARIFHDSEAVKNQPEKCCTILAQLVYLCHRRNFNEMEATDLFFSATKLFVSNDASVRRLLYLFFKEVYVFCQRSDVIIITSSLTRDMMCDEKIYRANALRVLVRIMDPTMLGAIERYIKSAIVSNSSHVASSALVSSLHLFCQSSENASIIKRWVREIQEALNKTNSSSVEYQALLLLYQIKKSDRLAVSKLVQQYSSNSNKQANLKSPLSLVSLIRYTWKLMVVELPSSETSFQQLSSTSLCFIGYKFFKSCLRSQHHVMVKYEAARAICTLCTKPEDVYVALDILDYFLRDAEKPSIQLAAMKTLASLQNPRLVSRCRDSLESVMLSSHKLLRTLAMSTLLKNASAGDVTSIDVLLRQVNDFATTLEDDENKITVISSLLQLSLSNPSKDRAIILAMANFLKQEGGWKLKQFIITSFEKLMAEIPECSEFILMNLCEYSEDCEYTLVSTRILHLIGDIGPICSKNPSKFIRYLYNRMILEANMIRAAAVSSLGKFAAACPQLRQSILTLLKYTCHYDHDDETRDRASILVTLIEKAMKENSYEIENNKDNSDDEEYETNTKIVSSKDDFLRNILLEKLPMSFDRLERSLKEYQSTSETNNDVLSFDVLPTVPENVFTKTHSIHNAETEIIERKNTDISSIINGIPELAALGRIFRSSHPILLTEKESEYVVSCIKHIMDSHVVLQFIIENTLEDQILKDVIVSLESEEENSPFEATGEIVADSIKFGESGNCYIVLQQQDNNQKYLAASCTFHCEMKFSVVTIDPSSEEIIDAPYNEEFLLEHLEMSISDFMAKTVVTDFRKSWEALGTTCEVLEKYSLTYKNFSEALSGIIGAMGMEPCDGTGKFRMGIDGVVGGKPHMLHLSGTFLGGYTVLARAQLAVQSQGSGGVILKLGVRSKESQISRLLADSIG